MFSQRTFGHTPEQLRQEQFASAQSSMARLNRNLWDHSAIHSADARTAITALACTLSQVNASGSARSNWETYPYSNELLSKPGVANISHLGLLDLQQLCRRGHFGRFSLSSHREYSLLNAVGVLNKCAKAAFQYIVLFLWIFLIVFPFVYICPIIEWRLLNEVQWKEKELLWTYKHQPLWTVVKCIYCNCHNIGFLQRS